VLERKLLGRFDRQPVLVDGLTKAFLDKMVPLIGFAKLTIAKFKSNFVADWSIPIQGFGPIESLSST
jgi:hypothetical protein